MVYVRYSTFKIMLRCGFCQSVYRIVICGFRETKSLLDLPSKENLVVFLNQNQQGRRYQFVAYILNL